MTNQDDFDDHKGRDFLESVGPKAAFFIVLIALSFMIGVVWKLYSGGDAQNSAEQLPVIRAQNETYKVEPSAEEGIDTPHQDSTIFSSLNSDGEEDDKIENLLAQTDEEEPVSKTQLFAGLNTDTPDLHAEVQDTSPEQPLGEDEERIVSQAKEAENVVTSLVEEGAESIVDAEEDVDATEEISAEESKNTETADAAEDKPVLVTELESAKKAEEVSATEKDVKAEPETKAETKTEPVQKTAVVEKKSAEEKPVLAAGDYFIQLASVREKSATEAEWNKLKAKYGNALQGYSYRVETADLGDKGTFYRIQAGPVAKAQADQTCAAIKRVDASGCLVKKK